MNDTTYCDRRTDGNFRTTNSVVRYYVNNDSKEWSYAIIEAIYRVRPYGVSAPHVTLLRVSNFKTPDEYYEGSEKFDDASTLTPLTPMSDGDVVSSPDHLFLVTLEVTDYGRAITIRTTSLLLTSTRLK